MKTIVNDVRFMQKDTLCFGDLHLEDGFVERIDYKTPKPYSDIAIPGFVDIHTHGFHGLSCATSDPQQLNALADEYAKRGIVGFAATIDARPLHAYEPIIAAYRKAFQGEYTGARFYGIHLEGPYLNPLEAKDSDPQSYEPIDLAKWEDFLRRHHDIVRIVSIAPELDQAMEAIALCRHFDVQVSLGHTRCTYEQTLAAIEQGVSQVTHCCNAMEDIDHHQARALDAILNADILCELNMDGVHIQRPMLTWLIRLLGSQRIMAISDGSRFSGFEYPDGYVLDAMHVVKNNAVYRNNHLSSSFRDLLDAFRYLYQDLQYSLSDCIRMTSTNAAHCLQTLNYEIGLGKKADLVILDHNLECKDVIINGKRSL